MPESAKRRRFELRRRKLRELVEGQFDGNGAAFARAIGVTSGYVTNLLAGKKNLGENAAARICELLGLEAGWFDGLGDAKAPRGVPAATLALARRIAALGEPWRAAALAIVKIGEAARRRPAKARRGKR